MPAESNIGDTMSVDNITETTPAAQNQAENVMSTQSNSEETMTAEDKAEVMAAVQSAIAAWNTGDVDAFVQHFFPEVTRFFLDGELIHEGMDSDSLKASYRSGYKPNMMLRHPEVKIDNSTAIVTGYLVGTMTDTGDVTIEGTWRFSDVLIKQDSQWKSIHYHFSPLTPGHRQR